MMRRAAMLGVEPAAFWRLSLKEWRWLTRPGEAAAMTGGELARLAARWPDEDHAAKSGPSLAPSTAARSPSLAGGRGSR